MESVIKKDDGGIWEGGGGGGGGKRIKDKTQVKEEESCRCSHNTHMKVTGKTLTLHWKMHTLTIKPE